MTPLRLPRPLQSPGGALAAGAVATLVIGTLNVAGGYAIGLSVFYVIPILYVTWVAGRAWGFAFALLSAWVDTVTEVVAGVRVGHPLLPVWDFAATMAFYAISAFMLSELRAAMERERELARTDPLTGVANRRSFFERASQEIERSLRYARPFSVALLDLDDFKQVNDRFGHSAGDGVLRAIASAMTVHTRATDLVARLGGDEFAVLLPETDATAADALVTKLRQLLSQAMRDQPGAVTFSVGLVTFDAPPASVDDLIRRVDLLLYQVKRAGKDQLRHEVVTW